MPVRAWARATSGFVLALGLSLGVPAGAGAAPAAATLTGQVTRVVDGDSLYVQTPGHAEPIELRLTGIDAPESCQAGGAEARAALAGFVLGKTVTVDTDGRDVYGRTLGRVKVGELDVNKRMVIEGQAWSIRTKWNRGPYVAQERVAQALHRGVHAAEEEVETPQAFRRRHGPCEAPMAGPTTPTAPAAGDASPTGVAPPAKAPPTAAANGGAAPRRAPTAAAPAATHAGNTLVVAAAPTAATAAGFACDGRTRCSQMRSCEEAKFFVQHCPGTAMDGDGDGVPCERQWCGGR